MSDSSPQQCFRPGDFCLLSLACLVLFGYALIDTRTLTAHEAVQPENAREMFFDHDWIIPKYGGLPWLERPPLPHWIMVGIASLVGHCDREWVVRLAPILMASIVVLLVGWMGSLWYGRTIGLLSGLIMATMYEFVTFATDPEADIFLCAIVTGAIALFVRLEFGAESTNQNAGGGIVGKRPWPMLAFFIVLGMTNLAKGLLFGTIMALIPVAGFLLWNFDWQAIRRYVWLWGWLAFVVTALAWPYAAYQRYPDIIPLWLSDYVGRLNGGYIGEPTWYYLTAVPWVILPWTLPAFVGLWLTARGAFRQRSPERFLWSWAVLTPAVFSIPDGKHHHYLLQCMAPWAVFGALGAVKLWQGIADWPAWLRNPSLSVLTVGLPVDVALIYFRSKIPGPSWVLPCLLIVWPLLAFVFSWALAHRNGRVALGTIFGIVTSVYCLAYSYQTHFLDGYRDDSAFLREVRDLVGPEQTLLINRDSHPLDAFRTLFYEDSQVVLLHNLTFLLDARIPQDVFVLTRYHDVEKLNRYGKAEVVLQSKHTRAERTFGDRWTLFRMALRPDLPRRSVNVRITPMQVTGREEGPFLN